MNKIALLFFLFSSSYATASSAVIGNVRLPDNRNARLGVPTGAKSEVLISRNQYLISWNDDTRTLNWSAWMLTPGDVGSSGRQNNFNADPDLNNYLTSIHAPHKAVGATEYSGSCFDRGHQTPSGDRTSSASDNTMTFYMSNIIPQTAWLNRVIWEHLEEQERNLSKVSPILIYAGPIFDTVKYTGSQHDIAVPTKNFKIIADLTGKVLVAVIMPNITSTGTDPMVDHKQACDDEHSLLPMNAQTDDWKKYVTTISEIEKETGLSFSFLKPSRI